MKTDATFALTATLLLMFHVLHSAAEEPTLKRIAFGSCIKEQNAMPLLQTIANAQPDLMILLGDNIYADTTDMQVMQSKYAKLGSDPGLQRLRQACPVLATWDDHDYGQNDAGVEYSKKIESQRLFIDFWGDGKNSPRRRRPGVYLARTWGPPGKRVQVILLDTRYFRSPLATGPRRVGGPYYPDPTPEKTMLGKAQWRWLEHQLRQPAELRIVASSIQLVSESSGQETWSNLPQERARFLKLVSDTQANGVLVISGDRHWAEISRTKEQAPYGIYDVTSSSINQIHSRGTPTENKHRVDLGTFHRENYGFLEINWEQNPPQIKVSIRDLEDRPRIVHTLSLGELQPTGATSR